MAGVVAGAGAGAGAGAAAAWAASNRLLTSAVRSSAGLAKKGWLQSEEVGRTEDGPLANMLAAYLTLDRTMAYDKDLEAKVAALTRDFPVYR